MKTVIFDLDGTVLDTFGIALASLNEMLISDKRKPVDEPSFLRDRSARELMLYFNISPWRMPFLIRQLKVRMRKHMRAAKPFPRIGSVIKNLQKTYRVGILTTNSREAVSIVTKRINPDFVAVDSPVLGKHLALRKLIAQHRLDRKNTWYVGDEVRDIEACRKAGIKIIAVTWGYNSKKALAKAHPDIIIDTPVQLLKVLA